MASPVKILGTLSVEMYGNDETLVRPTRRVVRCNRVRTRAGQYRSVTIIGARVRYDRGKAPLRREH